MINALEGEDADPVKRFAMGGIEYYNKMVTKDDLQAIIPLSVTSGGFRFKSSHLTLTL